MNSISDKSSNYTVSGTNGLAITANINRKSWYIQNLATGISPLYVCFGAPANATGFNYVLRPQSSLTGYDGGYIQDSTPKYVGNIYVSGQNTNYISWELV